MDQSGSPVRFWFKRTLLTLLSGFFLWFGIDMLRAAYGLSSPFEFIAVFFASNFIILISAVLGLGFVLSMIRRLRNGEETAQPGSDRESGNGEEKTDAD